MAEDASNQPLTNVLNVLSDVQSELAGKTVSAIVEIKKLSQPNRHTSSEVSTATDYQTRQCGLTMGFFPWGYVAQQKLSTDSTITNGTILNNWCMRSNNFSEDQDTRASLHRNDIYLKGRSIEVMIYPDFRPSFVFAPLNVYDLRDLVASLDEIKIKEMPDLGLGNTNAISIEGRLDKAGFPKEYFEIVFDPSHQMFPIQGNIYLDGQLLTKWGSTFSDRDGGYFPSDFWYKVFRGNNVIGLSMEYSNIIVENQNANDEDLVAAAKVLPGSIVNDYTFSKPFTYIEGPRSPTPEMLAAMASSKDSIAKYQKSAFVLAPYVQVSWTRGRWIVITALGLFTALAAGALWINKVKRGG